MTGAFVWGLVAGLSFVIGGAIAVRKPVNDVVLGTVIGFGVGALISAVAYELVEEAGQFAGASGRVAIGLLGGAAAYVAVISGLEHVHGHGHLTARQVGVHAMSVVPEAIIIVGGLLAGHGIEVAVVVAVFICGVPEALARTTALLKRHIPASHIMAMWAGLAALCGGVAFVGYGLLHHASDGAVAVTLAAAGGAVLCNLTTGLVPEAYKLAGVRAGVATVAGFALSFALIEFG